MKHAIATTIALLTLPGTPVLADGLMVYGGAAITFATGGDPAARRDLNLYLEADYANLYLGASTDLYNDATANEIDLTLGYRTTTSGGTSYDVSYTRSLYPQDGGDCCGDFALSLSRPFADALTGTVEASYDPVASLADAHFSLDLAVNDRLTLTGKVGVVQNDGVPDTREWDLAAAYALGETTSLTLHCGGASDRDADLGLDLNWDATLLGG